MLAWGLMTTFTEHQGGSKNQQKKRHIFCVWPLTWLLCAFSLVVDHDLLKDTHTDNVKSMPDPRQQTYFSFFMPQNPSINHLNCCIKQIDNIFLYTHTHTICFNNKNSNGLLQDVWSMKKEKKSADVDLTPSVCVSFNRSWSTTNENAHRRIASKNVTESQKPGPKILKQNCQSMRVWALRKSNWTFKSYNLLGIQTTNPEKSIKNA